MATLLQITNQVLKRLREETVTDLTTDDYVNLVATFVTEAATDVNEAGPGWAALDHTINVAVTAAIGRAYDLSATVANGGNVANTDSPTTAESTLLWARNRPQAWMWESDTDTETPDTLIYLDQTELERKYQLDRDETEADPVYFTLRATTDNDGWEMVLWPTTSARRHVRLRFNTPEAELDADTDAATTIKVDNRAVRLGALLYALNERGEELGEPGNLAERNYNRALGDAIEREIRVRERAGHFDWIRN
jgi:hypothetical protein